MRLKKAIPITETRNVEVAMDAINALNHATFWSGDQNINSATFGVIGSMFYPQRVVQFRSEDEKRGGGHGCHQRAQPRHVLERRSEHQLRHLRGDRLHVLSAARGAVRGTLHILMAALWEQLSGARV